MKIWVFTGRRALRLGLLLFFISASLMYVGLFRIDIAVYNPDGPDPAEHMSTAPEEPDHTPEQTEPNRVVALTFDSSWGGDHTEQILKILREADAKATFFVVGYWVDRYPDQLLLIDEAGHEIGNHSNTHAHMRNMAPEDIEAEISLCNRKIADVIGRAPKVFRSPYDEYDDTVLDICELMGLTAVHWDVDALDWQEIGAEAICEQVLTNVQDKSVVLLHMNSEYVVDALPSLLAHLKVRGYRFVTVSELTEMPPLPLD